MWSSKCGLKLLCRSKQVRTASKPFSSLSTASTCSSSFIRFAECGRRTSFCGNLQSTQAMLISPHTCKPFWMSIFMEI